jgi:hypothetical protein
MFHAFIAAVKQSENCAKQCESTHQGTQAIGMMIVNMFDSPSRGGWRGRLVECSFWKGGVVKA